MLRLRAPISHLDAIRNFQSAEDGIILSLGGFRRERGEDRRILLAEIVLILKSIHDIEWIVRPDAAFFRSVGNGCAQEFRSEVRPHHRSPTFWS